MRRAVLGEGQRTGVQVGVGAAVLADGEVEVSAEKVVALFQRRRILGTVVMAVGSKDVEAVDGQKRILSHHGETEDHLVHFGVTVPADAQEAVRDGIKHSGDSGGIIVVREGIPGPVIEKVAQQKQAFSLLILKSVQKSAAPRSGAVKV